MNTVTPSFVQELIDFAPNVLAKGFGFAEHQLEGTVALFNMLQRNRCAYLADGKSAWARPTLRSALWV